MPTNKTRYDDFDRLVMRHRRWIRLLCCWYSRGNAADTADLVQEVLERMWRKRESLREGATESEERIWIRWQCRSVAEHHNRRQPPVLVSLDEQEIVDDTTNVERRELLLSLTEGLNDRERQLLDLLLEGYSTTEAAEKMGMKPHTADQLRFRMIQKMREEMEKNTQRENNQTKDYKRKND